LASASIAAVHSEVPLGDGDEVVLTRPCIFSIENPEEIHRGDV
jgi:hypothetical protein